MSNFTPGPWFITNPNSNGTFYVESRIRPGWIQEVASCGPTEDPEHRAANARLIAAAPELLKALAMAVMQNDHDMLMTGEELRECRAVIAEATGE